METTDKDFKRLEGHPEPQALAAHEEEVAAPAAVTSDADEVRGTAGGAFGWAALAGLAVAFAVGAIAYLAGVFNAPEQQPPLTAAATVQSVRPAKTSATAQTTPQATAADEADAVYLFPLNGTAIADNAELNAVADRARRSGADVTVNAYTDESGRAEYNQRLSERRARAVGDYLVAHGVPAAKVHTHGRGTTHAYATAALDRRAEIYLN